MYFKKASDLRTNGETTDLCSKGLTEKLKAFTSVFTKCDLRYRRCVKLGTHPTCLLKYIMNRYIGTTGG